MRPSYFRFTVLQLMATVTIIALLFSIPRCLIWLEDSTYYAKRYSDSTFALIHAGMRRSEVIQILGEPLEVEEVTEYIEWIYGPPCLYTSDHPMPYTLLEPVRSNSPSEYTIVLAKSTGEITFVSGDFLKVNGQSLVGSRLSQLESRYGKPLRILHEDSQYYLSYSRTRSNGSYFVRKIGINSADRVTWIVAGWYQD